MWTQIGKRKTEVEVAGQPMVLLRLREAMQVSGGTTVDPDPTPGVMAWIEAVR